MKTSLRLLGSALVALLIIAIWSAVWSHLSDDYARLIISVLQPFVAETAKLRIETGSLVVYDAKGTAIVRKRLDALNEFGLLFALFLVMPTMAFVQRLKRLFLAVGVQMLLHVMSVALLIWIAYEFYFGINKQSFAYWLLNLLMAGNLIFPILIWALLTWRSWLPKLAPPTAPPSRKKRHTEEVHP